MPSSTQNEIVEVWLEPVGGDRVRVPDDGTPFLIGRRAAANLVITDPSCSRDHAWIRCEAGGAMLEPHSLRQPTMVNGTPHERPVRLASGDVLGFGEAEVKVIFIAGVRSPDFATPRPNAPRSRPRHFGATALDTGAEEPRVDIGASPMAVNETLLIGRGTTREDDKLALDHPTISLRHASVTRAGDQLSVRDLGSTNGTFVNGTRVHGTRPLRDGERLRVGPFTYLVRGTTLVPQAEQAAAQLTAHHVTLTVPSEGGHKQLLNDVSIGVRASEFMAIIGPSGCGKSTLIRILSGRASPTNGSVSWKATDLHQSFEALKAEIAFVPQRETLSERLTVRQALTYTARMRLAADVSAAERARIVDETIATVGLQTQADLPISRLSGGQRKRTGLANELLVSPSMMFLDEVTSGLDEATDREMMTLFRTLADRGIVVVCVTHTLANVEGTCDSLLVMATGGSVAYHGPVDKVRDYFGIKALGDVYPTLGKRAPSAWSEQHAAVSPYRARAATAATTVGVRTPRDGERGLSGPSPDRRPPLSQLWVLLERYLEITLADPRTLAMAGVQSLVIAAFLRLVFGGDSPVPPREYLLVFLLGVSAFWFGCNNAAKEIVKERPLFHLERDVNLRLPSYLWSKLIVLGFIGVLQTALLFACVRMLGLTFDHAAGVIGVMMLTVLSGTACGLAISAAADSEDQAITIVPIVLIPQLLLSDAVVSPQTNAATVFAKGGISTYWVYRALRGAMAAPGIHEAPAMQALAAHTVGYALIAFMVLWYRERARRV